MIKIFIPSIKGRGEFQMPVAQAAEFIKVQSAQNAKWAYLDGNYISPDAINEKVLVTKKEVSLVNSLAGG